MPSQTIGRYQIQRQLGEGGMAVVYLAHDPNFERQVVIKVIKREYGAMPEFHARFNREARVIARLEHETIVPVHDFGEHDGQPYIVMRQMTGGSLADRLADGPLPLPEAARIIERIADALDYAHSQGIIHRDLKPGNILFDGRGKAYLSDFGIAKSIKAATKLTGTGAIGTPAYMSPEQIQAVKNLDRRSDVYSLGVMAFELLTGELPFKAHDVMGLMFAHVNGAIPDILKSNPDLPRESNLFIRRALAKNIDDRYQTAGELASALTDLFAILPASKNIFVNVHDRYSRHQAATDYDTKPSRSIPDNLSGINIFLLGFSSCLSRIAWFGLIAVGCYVIVLLFTSYVPEVLILAHSIWERASSNSASLYWFTGLLLGLFLLVALIYKNTTRTKSGNPSSSSYINHKSIQNSERERNIKGSPSVRAMTMTLLADLKPQARKEIASLIGRKHELRITNRIASHPGGRFLLHGFGRFGSTVLIEKIAQGVKHNLNTKPENVHKVGVVLVMRIELTNVDEAGDVVSAIVRQAFYGTRTTDYPNLLKKQIGRLGRTQNVDGQDESSFSIKLPLLMSGAGVEYSRKSSKSPISKNTKINEQELSKIISDFFDRGERTKAGFFERTIEKILGGTNFPLRVVFIIDKVVSEKALHLIEKLQIFKEERISFFVTVRQEDYLRWSTDTQYLIERLGFESSYMPCLWEDNLEGGFIECMMREGLSVISMTDDAKDFRDHIAFVARGSPGTVTRQILSYEYCEFSSDGIPTLKLGDIRNWDIIRYNAMRQRLLTQNWPRIIGPQFKEPHEQDQARVGLYEIFDWMDKQITFEWTQLIEMGNNALVPIHPVPQIQKEVIATLIDVLVAENFLTLSKGRKRAYRVVPRTTVEDFSQ